MPSAVAEILDPSVTDRAKDALARHAWREAYDLLKAADARGVLDPGELEFLAQAAWWVGRLPEAIEARERAYAGATKAGDIQSATIAAVNLAHDNIMRNAHSVATAWMNRAERLLADAPDNVGNGWLAGVRAVQAGMSGRLDEALAYAAKAEESARKFADRNLEVMALSCKGAVLVYGGNVDQGLALLEEATVAAVGGEVDASTAGGACCAAIGACTALGDWRRAGEWTEAQDRWCQREGINGYPGMCRLARAEIKGMRGEWLESEAEARRATDELAGFIPAAVGLAFYQIGEIRRRRGDLPAAEEALLRAHEYGRDPEPALSLVRLAKGKVTEAGISIARALDDPDRPPTWASPPGSNVSRLSLLPAQVEIALVAGDIVTARRAADDLGTLAAGLGSMHAEATAATALGAVLLAEGDASGAGHALRKAIHLWAELGTPYEGARARVNLAAAYTAEGLRERAAIELQTARTAFERLGATIDLRRTDDVLASVTDVTVRHAGSARERVVRTFAFTDIVDSTRFAELLGDDAWDKLIRWHDQALRGLVAEHRGEEIKATGDGFFLAFDDPDRAVACAVAIQRRLAEQRQTQGFAPAVRIGLHRTEANRVGLDYQGRGVNVAARIGAAAVGGEILVSSGTLLGSRKTYEETDRRSVELKGVSEPVEIVSIGWM